MRRAANPNESDTDREDQAPARGLNTGATRRSGPIMPSPDLKTQGLSASELQRDSTGDTSQTPTWHAPSACLPGDSPRAFARQNVTLARQRDIQFWTLTVLKSQAWMHRQRSENRCVCGGDLLFRQKFQSISKVQKICGSAKKK